MAVASPYAVFKAADQGWPPQGGYSRSWCHPAVDPAPVKVSRRQARPLNGVWAGAIQGELFQSL